MRALLWVYAGAEEEEEKTEHQVLVEGLVALLPELQQIFDRLRAHQEVALQQLEPQTHAVAIFHGLTQPQKLQCAAMPRSHDHPPRGEGTHTLLPTAALLTPTDPMSRPTISLDLEPRSHWISTRAHSVMGLMLLAVTGEKHEPLPTEWPTLLATKLSKMLVEEVRRHVAVP